MVLSLLINWVDQTGLLILGALRKDELHYAFYKIAVEYASDLLRLLFGCLVQVCLIVIIILNMYNAIPSLLQVEHSSQILRDFRRRCVLSMSTQLKKIRSQKLNANITQEDLSVL